MIKNKTVTPKKIKAVQALITSDTIQEAADTCGIGRATMYRFMQQEDFNQELQRAKRLIVNRAILRLQQSCRYAAQALAEICRDKEAPPSARVSAAKEILNSSLKAIEIEGIEDRLKFLEERFL